MRQMRYLYGFGNWPADDVQNACNQVYDLVNATICRLLIEVGLNESDLTRDGRTQSVTELLTKMVLDQSQHDKDNPLFKLEFAKGYPIVAVGAPASGYYRDVAERLHIGLHMPEHADVANAFGAVMGSIVQRSQVTVTQPVHGTFRLFHNDQPKTFDTLDEAKLCAEAIVLEEAKVKAVSAGAKNPAVTLSYENTHVIDEVDGELFLESVIIATAIGPACDWRVSD
jgi:N-methylhydantoinase A/oxoprolinase/acetone carboxylase beta subunit